MGNTQPAGHSACSGLSGGDRWTKTGRRKLLGFIFWAKVVKDWNGAFVAGVYLHIFTKTFQMFQFFKSRKTGC